MKLAQNLTSFGRAGLNLWWVIIDLVRERERSETGKREIERERKI